MEEYPVYKNRLPKGGIHSSVGHTTLFSIMTHDGLYIHTSQDTTEGENDGGNDEGIRVTYYLLKKSEVFSVVDQLKGKVGGGDLEKST